MSFCCLPPNPSLLGAAPSTEVVEDMYTMALLFPRDHIRRLMEVELDHISERAFPSSVPLSFAAFLCARVL